MNRRQTLVDQYTDGEEHLLFLDPEYFDEAIIGVAFNATGVFCVAYSEPKIIELLIKHDKMDPDEAMEWYQFNIVASYLGESTPLFIDDSVLE
jgi:hypothetical protein